MLYGRYDWKDQNVCFGEIEVRMSFSNPSRDVRKTGRYVWWEGRFILWKGQEELCVISMEVIGKAKNVCVYNVYNVLLLPSVGLHDFSFNSYIFNKIFIHFCKYYWNCQLIIYNSQFSQLYFQLFIFGFGLFWNNESLMFAAAGRSPVSHRESYLIFDLGFFK